MSISTLVDQTIAAIGPLDASAVAAAEARQGVLTKPPGSLGRLETLSIQLAGIHGEPIPQVRGKAVIVVAGDHGVASEGVSAYPAEVTPQMVFNFLAGGAAINALARHAGADITVIDAGVAVDLDPQPGLTIAKVGYGDMGIGNTTPSAAITAAITGADVATVTGRGTGVDDAALEAKIATIRRALNTNQPNGNDGLDVLIKVGGFEIGVLAGVMLGAASRNCAVVVDGFISGAAALIAWRLCPDIAQRFVAAHRSVEPGHNVGLQAMGLSPLLDMNMRLGEGTGAALAMHILEAAAKCLAEMATFAEAGVSDRDD